MRSTIIKHELAVGAFVAASIAVAGGFFMQRTREKGLLDTQRVHFTVPDGAGLQTGNPVMMKGVQVGQISDVKLTADHKVLVTCDITPRFAGFITPDAVASVVEPPLLGATKVVIEPGSARGKLQGDHELGSRQQQGFLKRVEAVEGKVEEVLGKVDGLAVEAKKALEVVRDVGKKVNEGEGLVSRLLNDKRLADDAAATLKDVREVVRAVREGKGALALAVNDERFADDLKGTVADVREVVREVKGGQGSLGRLLKDPKLVDESTELVKDVRRSLQKLNDLNEQARASMSKVQQVLDTTDKTIKDVGGLVGSAKRVTTEIADTLHRINTGEGTIAKLLNDPALYKETRSLLKELRESVEDLREQAPINSFIGVVFSAF